MRPARMICRPRSTASVHFREGSECVTDRTCCGSGCRIGAVTLLYAQSPRIAASSRPMAPTISASQIGIRFFATFLLPIGFTEGVAGKPHRYR